MTENYTGAVGSGAVLWASHLHRRDLIDLGKLAPSNQTFSESLAGSRFLCARNPQRNSGSIFPRELFP